MLCRQKAAGWAVVAAANNKHCLVINTAAALLQTARTNVGEKPMPTAQKNPTKNFRICGIKILKNILR